MFTVKQIENLELRDRPYQVREGKGFGIRVFPSGEKTWFFAYKFHGRQRMMALGGFPDLKLSEAREKFKTVRKVLANGKDPLEEKDRETREPTVKILVEDFLKRHVTEKAARSLDEYRRNLEKDVIPTWGRRRAKDIKRRDVIALLDRIVDRGSPNQANQVFKIVRRMFNFALERDLIEYTPCAGVKLPSQEVRKSRFFSEEEICTFWTELEGAGMSEPLKQTLRLILATGQRPGEVIGIHHREIEEDWWTIPAERAKNKREHRVFLSPLVKEIIATLPTSGYLFPSPRSKKPTVQKPIEVNALAHAVRRNSSWAQPGPQAGKLFFSIQEPWTPHDLRRSCATGLGRLGYTDELIGRVLNHTRAGVTAIYNRHKYDAEIQQALESWGRKLECIVTGQQADNVISFKK
ncbi:MAG: hypothetical protein BA869_01490 [Desulfuromonadales bacterium C00003107]|jgi:integrase|nr:MAG: hypothetical protein BA869_01490 [Desulfuromonadales bacterium C00003107]